MKPQTRIDSECFQTDSRTINDEFDDQIQVHMTNLICYLSARSGIDIVLRGTLS